MTLKELVQNSLDELDIKPKEPIGQGQSHAVYPDSKRNFVYKVTKVGGDINNEEIDLFRKYPKYFPEVGKSNERYVQLEQLVTDEAEDEFYELEDIFARLRRKITGLIEYEYLFDFFNYKDEIDNKTLNLFLSEFKKNYPNEFVTFQRYAKLLNNVIPIVKKELKRGSVDIHGANFGYSKDGVLKMLDV